jgi:hypothetical protein
MPLYFIFEIVAFILSCIFCINGKFRTLHFFVPFLFLIVFFEFGNLKGWFTVHKSNLWAINIIMLMEFLFYGLFLRNILWQASHKRLFLFLFFIVCLVSIFDNLFFHGFWQLNSYAIILNSISIIVFACIYFYELLNYNIEDLEIARYPYFWITTGLLFYYLGMFAFFVSFEYMAYRNNYAYYSFFKIISLISIIILYSCFSIAFLCNRRIAK